MTGSRSTSETRARRVAGWAVILGGLVGALLGLATADWHRRTLFDEWQRLAPREISGDKVAIVLIDSLSLDAVGPWPWPRYYIARLTEAITAQQPKAIGFDMVFAEPDALSPANFAGLYPQELDPATRARISSLPTMDAILANVFGRAPVVLARSASDHDGADPATLMVDPEIRGTPPAQTARRAQVLASLPEIDGVALGHGLVNGPPDNDGIVRRIPLTMIAGGRSMPGFAVELARIGLGAKSLDWHDRKLAIGSRTLEAEDTANLPFRMGALPSTAVTSAAEVLGGKVRPGTFTDKIVLVGQGAEGTADIVATPLQTEIFGVMVQAQAVDAILSNGWLSRPPWVPWAEVAAGLLLLVLILGAGGRRSYWLLGVALALAIALPLASFVAFDRANILFDPINPVLVGLSAAIAMWITLYMLARAERSRLAAALVEQRITAAQQDGELNAARRIQQGMVPSSDRLGRLDQRVGIGAVLRPARSVGGDFYDALMISPDKLLLVIGDVTGKGVPAALYMALSKAVSKSVLSRADGDLGQAMAGLNRELMADADEEMGVTMLVGILDCTNGELALVNAGHENPVVVRKQGAVESLGMRGGPPFCVVDFPYPEERVRLAPGDTLILITDGATEAQDAQGAMLGLDGVIEALRSQGDIPATRRAADLADRIRAFETGTDPNDDLTILTVRFRAI
ncbi:CHASE2 domain-containing protein [Novosphingobium tardum]|uniref:CHASE2 domain-containing protein n=1 Tax=Novosphingobium tardum TaxID=1538021 RepID=A0ABV8RSP2_9SPHN